MEPIKTVIVDDEDIARRGLAALLAQDADFDVVALCADAQAALATLEATRVDLLLLDIQMPEWSGFDLLERLPEEHLPVVIFITAHDAYAVRAFEARALDYVLKPVSPARLEAALAKAKARLREHQLAEYGRTLLAAVAEVRQGDLKPAPFLERILVKDAKGMTFFEVAELDWIEGSDYYVTLHAGARAALYRESLKHLEARLDPKVFLRIHASAIVNLRRATAIQKDLRGEYEVVLATGQRLQVSRRRKKDLLALAEGFRG